MLQTLVPADHVLDRRLSAGHLADALKGLLRKLRDLRQDCGADLLDAFLRPQCQERDPADSHKSANGENWFECWMLLDPLPTSRDLANILFGGTGVRLGWLVYGLWQLRPIDRAFLSMIGHTASLSRFCSPGSSGIPQLHDRPRRQPQTKPPNIKRRVTPRRGVIEKAMRYIIPQVRASPCKSWCTDRQEPGECYTEYAIYDNGVDEKRTPPTPGSMAALSEYPKDIGWIKFCAGQDEEDDQPLMDLHFFEPGDVEPIVRLPLDLNVINGLHSELGALLQSFSVRTAPNSVDLLARPSLFVASAISERATTAKARIQQSGAAPGTFLRWPANTTPPGRHGENRSAFRSPADGLLSRSKAPFGMTGKRQWPHLQDLQTSTGPARQCARNLQNRPQRCSAPWRAWTATSRPNSPGLFRPLSTW